MRSSGHCSFPHRRSTTSERTPIPIASSMSRIIGDTGLEGLAGRPRRPAERRVDHGAARRAPAAHRRPSRRRPSALCSTPRPSPCPRTSSCPLDDDVAEPASRSWPTTVPSGPSSGPVRTTSRRQSALAAAIGAAVRLRVPFKLTGGLHHALPAHDQRVGPAPPRLPQRPRATSLAHRRGRRGRRSPTSCAADDADRCSWRSGPRRQLEVRRSLLLVRVLQRRRALRRAGPPRPGGPGMTLTCSGSWVPGADESDYSAATLPMGVAQLGAGGAPHLVTRIGDHVLDLHALASQVPRSPGGTALTSQRCSPPARSTRCSPPADRPGRSCGRRSPRG